MKVIIDDKIPYIKGIIEGFDIDVNVIYMPGASFTPQIIHDADALIVRTRTKCNKALLSGSNVKFIATATIGFDHIDTEYCKEAGIYWTNCPGCNSGSVAQYIQSVLLLLEKEKGLKLNELTLGIVGVGHVGSKVSAVANKLGMRVLHCDPPRAEQESDNSFCSITDIADQCDIITFHTPLARSGKYPTFHLADESFLQSLNKKAIIINTSRGEVVDNQALRYALVERRIEDAVIDVWENEPNIMIPLLNKVFIGTPHIAGYSADGKANATQMSLDALCRFFKISAKAQINPPSPANIEIQTKDRKEALLQIYNPLNDSNKLKTNPEKFEWLRGNYPLRREESAYKIIDY